MKELITKDNCYIQHNCKKFSQNICNEVFCIRLYKMNELYDLSLLSMQQRQPIILKLDSSKVDENAYLTLNSYQQDIVNFVQMGHNVYICSPIAGNGKTSWAIKLIQAYLQKIWATSDLVCRALFINVPTYTRELKLSIGRYSEYIQMINDSVLTADIVVWDDIAIKSNSSYEYEQLLSIIDTRINDKKCNIFTSNVLPNDLSKCLGSRLSSRILGTSSVIELKGVDKRGWK